MITGRDEAGRLIIQLARRHASVARHSCAGTVSTAASPGLQPEAPPWPAGLYVTLELCGGAARFRLDAARRRVYVDVFSFAEYENEDAARAAFRWPCESAGGSSSAEEAEAAADAWLATQPRIMTAP